MTAAEPIETVAVAFIKMKEDKTDPVPGYFIHKDEKGNPERTGEVLIPINHRVNERKETWKGYIKVEKSGRHYFRIDGDDELTLKIPHAKIDITTGGGSLTTKTAEATLERGFYYCELVYTNKAYKPEEKSYEGCKAIMSTEGMPPEGKYVKNDTTKSSLAEGEAMKLYKLGLGCRVDWPKEVVELAVPIEWYEVANDNNGKPQKKDFGTISSVTATEFKQIACIIFAEQSQYNEQEYLAIASVFRNRWGRGRHGSLDNRTPIKTVAEDLVKKSWDSIGERQYTKAMEGTLNVQECPNLDKARETLEKVLGMAKAPYPYDRCVSHPGNLNPSNYVTIGGHDFYKNKQFRSCVKPDGWDEMPVAPGSPLDK